MARPNQSMPIGAPVRVEFGDREELVPMECAAILRSLGQDAVTQMVHTALKPCVRMILNKFEPAPRALDRACQLLHGPQFEFDAGTSVHTVRTEYQWIDQNSCYVHQACLLLNWSGHDGDCSKTLTADCIPAPHLSTGIHLVASMRYAIDPADYPRVADYLGRLEEWLALQPIPPPSPTKLQASAAGPEQRVIQLPNLQHLNPCKPIPAAILECNSPNHGFDGLTIRERERLKRWSVGTARYQPKTCKRGHTGGCMCPREDERPEG